jgi:hypothetical protein
MQQALTPPTPPARQGGITQFMLERGGGGVHKSMQMMDKITLKTPNPKCRLYWFLMKLIDWRYSQSC